MEIKQVIKNSHDLILKQVTNWNEKRTKKSQLKINNNLKEIIDAFDVCFRELEIPSEERPDFIVHVFSGYESLELQYNNYESPQECLENVEELKITLSTIERYKSGFTNLNTDSITELYNAIKTDCNFYEGLYELVTKDSHNNIPKLQINKVQYQLTQYAIRKGHEKNYIYSCLERLWSAVYLTQKNNGDNFKSSVNKYKPNSSRDSKPFVKTIQRYSGSESK